MKLHPLEANPFVSFVVINWNYARFLKQAITSVRLQSYENFECVVVDNASSDESREVILDGVEGDHRFTYLFLDENLNQLGALLHVLPALRGRFVSIVDADDFVFRDFASHHVQVHLASKKELGFTSSAVIECDGEGKILTGRFEVFGDHSGCLQAAEFEDNPPRLNCVPHDDFDLLRYSTLHIPETHPSWVWSPGTSNFYRREFLDLCRPANAPRIYEAAIDNYYAPFVNAVGSSALIQRPLSAYRCHGSNRFAISSSLFNVRASTRSGIKRAITRRRDIIATLSSAPEKFVEILGDRFWNVIDLPAQIDGLKTTEGFNSPEVRRHMENNFAKLYTVFGDALRERLGERMSADELDLLWGRCSDQEQIKGLP